MIVVLRIMPTGALIPTFSYTFALYGRWDESEAIRLRELTTLKLFLTGYLKLITACTTYE